MKEQVFKREREILLTYNWRVSSEKGEISILPPCEASMSIWEIYSLKGRLFEDIERYDSIFEMVDRIKELLT